MKEKDYINIIYVIMLQRSPTPEYEHIINSKLNIKIKQPQDGFHQPSEDSHDDEDFHQSHPRKRPIPRSPSLNDTRGFNCSSSSSKPDLKVLSSDSDLENTTRTDDDTIIISDNEDFSEGETSTNKNGPSDSTESSDTEESLPMCKFLACFLEGILSPGSIYVTNFQKNKVELVERLYQPSSAISFLQK
ncbi:uncharacterized protein LOC143817161 [Ranitomeya variabilis]|uniref:uncharacterized protein LOC143817161 n=1 Tax=Ranitomeya variabilis TaxID=490064 RepID=UPI0040566AA8